MADTCCIEGCIRPMGDARNMCKTHAWRAWAGKDVHAPIKEYARTPDDVFRLYVEPTGFCWNWTGSVQDERECRGRVHLNGVKDYAYRWVYEHLVGEVGDGLHLDHLCRNPNCVNPDHLEPVTNAVNTKRGARSGIADYCRKGLHRMVGENLYVNPASGRRNCVECRRAARRAKGKVAA